MYKYDCILLRYFVLEVYSPQIVSNKNILPIDRYSTVREAFTHILKLFSLRNMHGYQENIINF